MLGCGPAARDHEVVLKTPASAFAFGRADPVDHGNQSTRLPCPHDFGGRSVPEFEKGIFPVPGEASFTVRLDGARSGEYPSLVVVQGYGRESAEGWLPPSQCVDRHAHGLA